LLVNGYIWTKCGAWKAKKRRSAVELGQSALTAAAILKRHVSAVNLVLHNPIINTIDWTTLTHIPCARTHTP
jgi:hypothetical protein